MRTRAPIDDICGDPTMAAFRVFYEAEFGPQVRRAGMLLGSASDAADVVHDAFVVVWRRWSKLDEPGKYLNRCVINGCRTVARRNGTHDRAMNRLQPLLEDQSSGEVLWDALQALHFDQRAPLVLRYYGRLNNREIAAALGWPYGSVGPRITKGLRALRKALR